MKTYIGAPIRRREDVRFLTGRAKFVDDVKVPEMLHAAILRSPHAHARIKSIQRSNAFAIPGVVDVITFDEIAALARPIPIRMYMLPGLERYLQYPLARDKARYLGEPLAVAVAESRYVAEDALDAIEVTYEVLPAVVSLRDALRDETLVHEENGTNLAARSSISIGDVETAFREAEYTRREEFKVHRHTGNPLETRGLVASYDSGRGELTVWGPTKVPHFNRAVLSSFLSLPEQKIHFIEPDVGGGFGIRGEFYPEDFLIPFAAIRLRRPVKWIEDRREHLMAANHSRDVWCEAEIAARRDGTLLGLRARLYGDMGGYIRTHGGIVPASTAALLTGPYRIPAYECAVHCVMTNKTGLGTLRAPGRYESCFIRERLLDLVAADLHIDPAELRLKNLIQPEEMPYELGVTRRGEKPTVFDSGDYPALFKRALQEIGYGEIARLQGRHEQGKYHGIGIASYVKNTGRGPFECARVEVRGENSVALYLGLASLGQGHETTMAQICADGLGIPIEQITVFHGSTDLVPFGGGTFASRGTVMGGNAVYLAARQVKEKILTIAANYLDTPANGLEFREGHVYKKGADTDKPLLSLGEVVALAAPSSRYSPSEPGLDVTAYFKSDQLTYTYGTHAAHVTIDPETGKIEVLRYVAVEDVGRCINPLLMHGQSVGGVAQGIGATLLEDLVYDENGQLLTTTLMDYLLPTSTVVPPIKSITLENARSPLNPLGVKGGGEESILATGAALANAVANALASFGVKVTELPLSPDRVRNWIRRKT
ncbi:MAG: xanthine dehydrogenase family protein molybdopterin-binding subunit [Deltaproteobacteria bacterium]|nr:xanthine dehydrogenase family protein molybdopterin-binding subunit [Deltaproteobacteria bacterium]